MEPYNEFLREADINISSSGDTTVIAAPGAGHYLAIDFISLIATVGTTVQFKNGTTAYGGPIPLTAGQSITWENSFCSQYGVLTMGDNQPFVLNDSGNNQIGGLVRYRIVGE